MTSYLVRIGLVEYSSAEIEVEANSEDEAVGKAENEINDLPDEEFSRHDAETSINEVTRIMSPAELDDLDYKTKISGLVEKGELAIIGIQGAN